MQNIYPSTSNQYPLNSYQSIPNYTQKSPLNLPSQAAHSFTTMLNDDSNNYMPQVYTPYQTSNQRYHTAESFTGKETQDKPTSKQKEKGSKKKKPTYCSQYGRRSLKVLTAKSVSKQKNGLTHQRVQHGSIETWICYPFRQSDCESRKKLI